MDIRPTSRWKTPVTRHWNLGKHCNLLDIVLMLGYRTPPLSTHNRVLDSRTHGMFLHIISDRQHSINIQRHQAIAIGKQTNTKLNVLRTLFPKRRQLRPSIVSFIRWSYSRDELNSLNKVFWRYLRRSAACPLHNGVRASMLTPDMPLQVILSIESLLVHLAEQMRAVVPQTRILIVYFGMSSEVFRV